MPFLMGVTPVLVNSQSHACDAEIDTDGYLLCSVCACRGEGEGEGRSSQ